jgi:hypothetical protein
VDESTIREDLRDFPAENAGKTRTATRDLLSQSDQNDWRRKYLEAGKPGKKLPGKISHGEA